MAGGETPQTPDRYGELWAEVYDDEHAFMVPPESQLSFLAVLAAGGRALELGIGTGRVALPLAARGVNVEGLDASPSMVERLRSKPGGDAIPVTMGNMADLPVDGSFRLVYVVFNTFFGLLTQQDQVSCFKRVAAVLEPDGAFVMECFVPDLRRFDRGQSFRTISVDDHAVRLDASRHDPVAQQIVAGIVRLGIDSVSFRPVRLRYAWPAELDLMAEIAGMRLRQRWAGWSREDIDAASTSHISVYALKSPR
jgi:SAM-dependent methyltransferase